MGSWSKAVFLSFYLLLVNFLSSLLSIFYPTHSLSLNVYFVLISSWLVKLFNVAWNSKGSHCHCLLLMFSSYFLFTSSSISVISRAECTICPLCSHYTRTDILVWCCPLSNLYKQNTLAGGTQNLVPPSRKTSAEGTDRKETNSQNDLNIPPKSLNARMGAKYPDSQNHSLC